MKGKGKGMHGATAVKDQNDSQRPGGPNAGPESGSTLKSGLADRYQISRTHSTMGMDVGEGDRPKPRTGETLRAASGKKYRTA